MTVIAIEGPDRCGKTEIATQFSLILDGLDDRSYSSYYRASSQHQDFLNTPEKFVQNLRFADTRMLDMVRQMNLSIVLDRSWASEWVYSKAFNRQFDNDAMHFIDREFALDGAIIVIAQRSDYSNIVDDIDPIRLNGKKLQEIHDLFMQFAEWTKCNVCHLNVDDEDLDREVSEIFKFMNNIEKVKI